MFSVLPCSIDKPINGTLQSVKDTATITYTDQVQLNVLCQHFL
jgi:hypothetical protein